MPEDFRRRGPGSKDNISLTVRPARSEKLLIQTSPGAAVYSAAYTVPTNLIGIVSCIVITNTGAATTFRIHHSDSGGPAAITNALFYDTAIGANTTLLVAPTADGSSFAAAPGAIFYAGSGAGGVNFSFYGAEVLSS